MVCMVHTRNLSDLSSSLWIWLSTGEYVVMWCLFPVSCTLGLKAYPQQTHSF